MKIPIIKKKVKYPSSKVLLNILREEVQKEETRKTSIENRSGITLAFLGSIILALPMLMKFPNSLFKSFPTDPCKIIILIAIVLVYLFVYGLLLRSIWYVFKAIMPDNYEEVSTNNFNKTNSTYAESTMEIALIETLSKNLVLNREKK